MGSAQHSPIGPDDLIESRKSLPLVFCPFCGSTWFRVVDVKRCLAKAPEEWWELREAELLNRTHPRLRICLCGAPLRPDIGGVLSGGRAILEERVSFKNSLDGALANMESSRSDLEKFLKSFVKDPLAKDRLDAAAARLRRGEEMVLWEQRKADPKAIFGARKPWKDINREAEAKTALGRDDLVLALQKNGITYRMARRLVKVILEECCKQLRLDQVLETPIGTFRLAKTPKEREHSAFGYTVTTYKKTWWVHFRPAADLSIRADADGAEAEAEEEDEEMARRGKDKLVACPRCKSTWLMEAKFRQYVEAYGSSPGADIVALDGGAVIPSRVCLCGHPVGPALKNAYHLQDFLANVKKARQYLKQVGAVEEAVERIMRTTARLDYQEQLLARMDNVETGLKTLGWDPTEGF